MRIARVSSPEGKGLKRVKSDASLRPSLPSIIQTRNIEQFRVFLGQYQAQGLFFTLLQAKAFVMIGIQIDAGVGLEERNSQGKTPFVVAVQREIVEIVRLLLTKNINANARDKAGNSALSYAVQQGNEKLVMLILKRPDVEICPQKNGLPLEATTSSQNIRRIIERARADRERREDKGDKENKNANQLVQSKGKAPLTDLKYRREELSSKQVQSSSQKGWCRGLLKGLNGLCKSLEADFDSMSSKKQVRQMKIVKQLGRGSFGEVYLADLQGKPIALKLLDKTFVKRKGLKQYLFGERDAMRCSEHPFIMDLLFAAQTRTKYMLGMKYMAGGDLGSRVGNCSLEELRTWAAEIILALEHLHSRNIVYRDLKPENVLLDDDDSCVLTDFGLCKQEVYDSTTTFSFCGSFAYLPPEIIEKKGHNKTVDWYLLGVLLYQLHSGRPPFYHQDRDMLFHMILHSKLEMPVGMDANLANLIAKLMTKDPAGRLGAQGAKQVKKHPFFGQVNFEDVFAKKGRGKSKAVAPSLAPREQLTELLLDFEEGRGVEDWSFYK